MEVHAHTHTARKKWTHYFWEFMMLFLAVFCGFLTENQREHMVEHRRAKEYASNLYNELQNDTMRIERLINWTQRLVKTFDTLCDLSRKSSVATNGELYYYSHKVGWVDYFSSSCSTLDQLKNSGNLRILSPKIVQKISNYDRLLTYSGNTDSYTRTEYENINNLRLKIFDGFISFELNNASKQYRDSVFLLNPPLLNDDPKLMKEFIGWVKIESGFLQESITENLRPLEENAKELLSLLKKEYHLE
jgi:hypothetical protein